MSNYLSFLEMSIEHILLDQKVPLNVITVGQILSDRNKQIITSTNFPFQLNKPALHLSEIAKTAQKW
jgi:hypothetical protein